MTLEAFLQAIIEDPLHAATTWAVLADWLEDHNDPRSELVRLLYQRDYHPDWSAEQRDERVRQLLASGVEPVVPTLVNSIGMKFALIPAGTFWMGTPDTEGEVGDDEHPRHEVEITRPFFMGVFQVTQEEYQRVTGKNPSHFSKSGGGKATVKKLSTDRLPVEMVSHKDAVAFCKLLPKLPEEKQSGRSYRLPTEAQWEYACRGGATSYTPFHFGNSLCSILANFNGNLPHGGAAKGPYLERPCSVGSYPPNAFGLFDMHGNVWEWCLDWYDETYYQNSPKRDPQGPEKRKCGLLRGGAWDRGGNGCRAAYRIRCPPDACFHNDGFRVCCLQDL